MNLGEKIKYFRSKKGITVNKLANISGISQSYLRDIELGNKQPTVEYLSYICEGLGISLETFFAEDKKDHRLLCAFAKLTPEQKELLISFIEAL